MTDDNPGDALQRSSDAADRDMGSRDAGGAKENCPAKTWIEIELVGEDDRPIPDEKYRIELPDGRVVEGSLDAEGTAGVEGIDPGTCQITFPELDGEAWERIEGASEQQVS